MGYLQLPYKIRKLVDGSSVAIVDMKGSIDGSTVKKFEADTLGLAQQGIKYLILNFAEVGYMNSTGLGILVKVLDKYQENDGNMKLVQVSRKIADLFDMLGISSILQIYGSVDNALDSLPVKLEPDAAPPPPPPPSPAPQPQPPSRSSGSDTGILISAETEAPSQGIEITADFEEGIDIPAATPIDFPASGTDISDSGGIDLSESVDLSEQPEMEFGGVDLSSPENDKPDATTIDAVEISPAEAVEISAPAEAIAISAPEEIEISAPAEPVAISAPIENAAEIPAPSTEQAVSVDIPPSSEDAMDMSPMQEAIAMDFSETEQTEEAEEMMEEINEEDLLNEPTMEEIDLPQNQQQNVGEENEDEYSDLSASEHNIASLTGEGLDMDERKAETFTEMPRSEAIAEKQPAPELPEELQLEKQELPGGHLADSEDEEEEMDEMEEEEETEAKMEEMGTAEKMQKEAEDLSFKKKKMAAPENVAEPSSTPLVAAPTPMPVAAPMPAAPPMAAPAISSSMGEAPVGAVQKQPSAPPAPIKRKTAVRYYEKMNPNKDYPLIVTFSKEQIKKIAMDNVGQTKGKKTISVKRDKPQVVVTPCLAGCVVSPPSITLDLTPEIATAEFSVAPVIEGELKSWIEVSYQGQVVEKIALNVESARQTLAKIGAVGAIVSPVLSYILDGFQLDLQKEAAHSLPHLLTWIHHNVGLLKFGLLSMIVFIGGSLFFYYRNKARKAEELEKFLNVEPEASN